MSLLTRAKARWSLSRKATAYARKRRGRVVSLVVLFAHLAGALTSVRAIMDVRTAQGTIAWVVSLNTLPYVAVPAYWVFGRSKFHGYVLERRKDVLETKPVVRQFMTNLQARALLAFPGRNRALLVEKLAKLPFTQGNEAELLINGDATFKSIFEGIDRAQHYVLAQFYIIRDDQIGREFKRRLILKAQAGVRVSVLYDEVGSAGLPRSYIRELQAAGVQVKPFNTTQGSANRFQVNFRNHRKIVIVDGLEAWVGGLNVGDEYLGRDSKIGFWRDTHTRLRGPVVPCVQVSFVEDWHWATGELPKLNWDPQPAPSGQSLSVLCLPSGPADQLETCALFFVYEINRAQKRIWIASPYFVPDEQILTALKLAALRGVDVRILIPEHGDSPLVQLTAWSYLDQMESVGIRCYHYTKGFMHHKVLMLDDECTIGTANFDNRSFRLNFEITLQFVGRDFTDQVAAMLERDFADARPVNATELQAQGFWSRFAVRAARLVAPIQ
jgi:cardiolipin synthase A/B